MPQLDVDHVVSNLTLEEKIALLSGKDFWHTYSVPRLNVPSLRFTDGPNGARGTRFVNCVRAACLPCGTCLATSWDTSLLERAGHLMGKEAIAKGAHVILGPTVNVQRSPLGGRGFESFSEDPVLSGYIASAMINGIQGTGVSACLKHFVCNDLEHERQAVNCVVSQRALREIYLAPFWIALRKAKPWAFMTSYNKVNGIHVSEDPWLITDILRNEWGFDGFVMSDWFGTYSAAESTNAGLDLEMPGPPKMRGTNVNVSVGNRKLAEHVIDDRIRNLMRLINRVERLRIPENAPEREENTPETSALLREIAGAGIVLLKNDRQVLPIDRNKAIAVMGPNATFSAYAGGGSANLNPYYASTPLDGIREFAKDIRYTLGANAYKQLPLISNLTQTSDGRQGLLAKFFNEPPELADRLCRDVMYVDRSDMFLADYSHPDVCPELFYVDLEGTITPEVSGEYFFGCSVRGTAKIYIDDELIVDNATEQVLGGTFMGAGTREEKGSKDLQAGRCYRVKVTFGSASTQTVKKKGTTAMRGGGIRVGATLKMDPVVEIQKAVRIAKETEQVVICAGLNGEWESEGFDRPDMDLPGYTNDLITAVAEANPNTIVVMQSGTPVAMPWIDKISAIIHAWYGGNESGNAIADVLFGEVNPSGKLPISFPKRVEDNPAFLHSRSEKGRMLYGEDIYVGYRYYEMTKREVLFPFGHGLSYTQFSMSGLKVDAEDVSDTIIVSINVKNYGQRHGAEVVQVYVQARNCEVTRPMKELKGFSKVSLVPGEEQRVFISIEKKYAVSYWDEERNMWAMEKGTYDILVGNSTDNILDRASFEITKSRWWKGL